MPTIFVSQGEDTESINIDISKKINILKEIISEKFSVPIHQQQLTFNNKILTGGKIISSYKISEYSRVKLDILSDSNYEYEEASVSNMDNEINNWNNENERFESEPEGYESGLELEEMNIAHIRRRPKTLKRRRPKTLKRPKLQQLKRITKR